MSDRDSNPEIYVVGADGSMLTRLTDNSTQDFVPTWAPDGSRIAFSTPPDHQNAVYVVNADGSEPIRLARHPASDDVPCWIPIP